MKDHTRHLLNATPMPQVVGYGMMFLGIAIALGGRQRMGGRSFAASVSLVHGHVWIWGLFAWTAGILVAYGAHKSIPIVRIVGYWLGCAWCFFFAITFAWTAMHDRLASYTGIAIYSLVGAVLVVMGRAARGR